MTETAVPSNVYRVAQREFDAIPRSPWVYWAPERIRCLFEDLPSVGEAADPTVGLQTGQNVRFLRYWWEVGRGRMALKCRDRRQARATGKKWFPYMKGGGFCRWYGNQRYVVNWGDDGAEIRAHPSTTASASSENRRKNEELFFREGVTYSYLTSGTFSARLSPGGFIFDVAGSSLFPEDIALVLSVMNSKFAAYVLKLINPTVNFQVGDLARMPLSTSTTQNLCVLVNQAVNRAAANVEADESTFDFVAPPRWDTGLDDLAAGQSRLTELEQQIDQEVYQLYSISDADRAAIEAELAGGSFADEDATPAEEDEEATAEVPLTREELAVRWVSYAVGIVLGRFEPRIPGALGSAVYHRADFAVGSLAEPDEVEFDQLVGPVERFAYVGADGGRHLFPAEAEEELRELALPDGIAVFDEGHPRDLPVLVERTLTLVLGEASAHDVIAHGAGGTPSTAPRANLRKFLERDFFTKWHLKWYRKRPVYWPLQSPRRSYGFVLCHERVERSTLYVLQREYLDHKLNGLRLQIGDLRRQLEGREGRERKQIEGQIETVTQMLDELTQFAETIDRAAREGYEPEPNWIDDGIILRLAPLRELIPIWKSEPKKHWERLQRGDFDWSHIAMHYWPKRVVEKCKSDKSLAVAHGV